MLTMSTPDPAATSLSQKLPLKVHWGQCDAASVVFYPQYFMWFDACTHALLDSVGLDHRHLRDHYGIVGAPLVDVRAQFLAPATYGQDLIAFSWIHELGRRRFSVRHRLSHGETTICEGHEMRVWAIVNPENPLKLEAMPIPDDVRHLLSGGAVAGKPTG